MRKVAENLDFTLLGTEIDRWLKPVTIRKYMKTSVNRKELNYYEVRLVSSPFSLNKGGILNGYLP